MAKVGLSQVLGWAMQKGYPFAAFRLPNETVFRLMIQTSSEIQKLEPKLEVLPKGFLVSPFVNPELSNTTFFKADIEREWEGEAIDIEIESTSEEFLDIVRGVLPQTEELIEDKKHFTDIVAKGIKAIGENRFRKVVLGRTKTVETTQTPDQFFYKLCKAYPTTFVNLCFLPDYGLWIGASPEILLRVKNHIFESVALAGTQLAVESVSPKEVFWSQKDIEEQALVTRYIIECFKKIRLREYEEIGPKTVVAGNLMHLKTEFKVDMKVVDRPELGGVMLPLLHPTSAVCGTPKEEARYFILDNEGFDRKLFCGFWGPVGLGNNETHLYVNIRSMEIMANKGILYAAAGITEESDPEKEWQETGAKLNTLGRLV